MRANTRQLGVVVQCAVALAVFGPANTATA
jgi:hypothetical protein